MSLSDIASAADVRLSAVSNWRARHADFPAPEIVDGQEAFSVREVASWLRKRRIPRNRLRSDESPGASYGDRFQMDVVFPNPQLEIVVGVGRHSVTPAHQLWTVVDRLRNALDADAALEYVLGLLYVRTRRPEVWAAVTSAAGWDEAREQLSRVAVEVGARPAVPVFAVIGRTSDPSFLEAVRLVDRIDFSADAGVESIEADLSEIILDNLERGLGRSGGFFTPPDVARCLVELLNPQRTDGVYDPFTGSGELLVAAAAHIHRRKDSLGGWKAFGQASHERSWLTATMNLALHGVEADLSLADNVFEDDRFAERRFDRILANPPFNVQLDLPPGRVWPFGEPPEHSANFAWLQHAVTKLAPGGRAAVIMPDGAAFAQGARELAIRKAMVEAGAVECVIALPSHLFRFTGVQTTIWVLRALGVELPSREVLFIDAKDLGEMVDRGRRKLSTTETARIATEYQRWRDSRGSDEFVGTAGFSRSVGHGEIEENNWILQPSRYVRSAAEELGTGGEHAELVRLRDELAGLSQRAEKARSALEQRLTSALAAPSPGVAGEFVDLGEVCDVLSGPGRVTRSGRQSSWTPLVLPRNIRNDRVEDKNLDLVSPETADGLTRYRLNAADIVSARVGTLGRYGLVEKSQAGWLLGPGCVRFRPQDGVSPEYLTFYLGSPRAYAWLMKYATGSAIQHVNTATLRAMPVWLPGLTEQLAVVDAVEPFRAAATTHAQLSATTRELRELLASMLMSPAEGA
jgi:type I restriction enzyme M protein